MSASTPPSSLAQTATLEEGLPFQQAQRLSRQAQAQGCPKCSAPTTPGARFCTECGASLIPHCPACAAEVLGGDFCQACGHWLLDEQCRFCYAALANGARFCEDCGCNQSGLVCPRCQTTGFFDFCSACGDAVSEKGQMLARQSVQDPALELALQSMQQMQARLAGLAEDDARPAQPPAKTAPAAPARLVPRAALQTLKDMEAAAQAQQALDGERAAEVLAQARAAAEQARREAAEAQAQAQSQTGRQEAIAQVQSARLTISAQLREAQRQVEALLKSFEGVTHATPQAARCSFMQLRSRLAALGKVPTGWRCLAYNCVHETPNDCANPAAGGSWVF
jgi:predicted amidophosphoribosyltransferase